MTLSVVLGVPAFLPADDYGGPVPTVLALARGLIARGHRVEVWCADFGPGRTRVPAGSRVVDGVPVRYLRRLASYRWSPIVPGAFFHGRACDADVMHLFGYRDGLTTLLAAGRRAAARPYVMEPMGMVRPVVRSIGLKRLFDGSIGGAVLRGASGLVATSAVEAAEIGAHNATTWTRPNPLDTTALHRQHVRDGGDDLVVGFVGRISTKKGLDLLCDALGRTSGIRAIVAGPDAGDGGTQQLRTAIEVHGLHDTVSQVGPVWREARDELFSSLDVLVLPSRTENFGNVVAEAVAAGLPVVVTDRCGVADAVERHGCGLVVPFDAAALAAALTRMQDRHLRQELRANGAAFCAELDPATVAERQEAIYLAALGRQT